MPSRLIDIVLEDIGNFPELGEYQELTPFSLSEFDRQYTARYAGFESVDDYYNECSAQPHLKKSDSDYFDLC